MHPQVYKTVSADELLTQTASAPNTPRIQPNRDDGAKTSSPRWRSIKRQIEIPERRLRPLRYLRLGHAGAFAQLIHRTEATADELTYLQRLKTYLHLLPSLHFQSVQGVETALTTSHLTDQLFGELQPAICACHLNMAIACSMRSFPYMVKRLLPRTLAI